MIEQRFGESAPLSIGAAASASSDAVTIDAAMPLPETSAMNRTHSVSSLRGTTT